MLHEKGGRFHRVPAHHKAAEYVEAYLETAGIAGSKRSPLFRTARGKTRELTDRAMASSDVLRMIKRRSREAGLPAEISNHTFRATGITAYLENGGTLETAARLCPRTYAKILCKAPRKGTPGKTRGRKATGLLAGVERKNRKDPEIAGPPKGERWQFRLRVPTRRIKCSAQP